MRFLFSPLLFLTAAVFSAVMPLAVSASPPEAPKETPIQGLHPLFDPIEPAYIPSYMGKIPDPPKISRVTRKPYSGWKKGPQLVTFCLNSGLACFKPANEEEWKREE